MPKPAHRRPGHHEPRVTDQELLRRCREGDSEAFGELFMRHRATARRVAASASSRLDPDDVSSEAFARIWSALRAGAGPEHAFGPYLRATIQNLTVTLGTRDRESPTDDDRLERDLLDDARVDDDGFSTSLAEHAVLVEAFNSLPERWRDVLWLIDVEELGTPEVAERLGLTPNATAALTLRARDGLSRAWLQQHLELRNTTPDCRWVQRRMGGYVRHALSTLQRARIEQHLQGCGDCSRVRGSMAHLALSLRAAALVAGGSMLGAAWAFSGAPRAVAATRALADDASGGSQAGTRAAGRRLVRPSRPVSWAGGAATAVAVTVLALSATHGAEPGDPTGAAQLIRPSAITQASTASTQFTGADRSGTTRSAPTAEAAPTTDAFPRSTPTVGAARSTTAERSAPMVSPAEPPASPVESVPTPTGTTSPTEPVPTPTGTASPAEPVPTPTSTASPAEPTPTLSATPPAASPTPAPTQVPDATVEPTPSTPPVRRSAGTSMALRN